MRNTERIAVTAASADAGSNQGTLCYGMVGGGPGSFIGAVHRGALALEGDSRLVAGCFSRDRASNLATGRSLGLDDSRIYADWAQMAASEALRQDRIDFVVIVTPNNLHAPVSLAFMDRGIHVACDKPLAVSSEECARLSRLAAEKGAEYCVTYTYTGYPAVKHAKRLIEAGVIGDVVFVNAEYPQEFFASPAEREGNRQAEWRFDPARSGPVGTLGDLGTHIENLVAFITGLRIARLSAKMGTIVPGRALDDNDIVNVEYEGGAAGLYWACQAAPGEGNDLKVRIYGTRGSLRWRQENPDELIIDTLGEPRRIWKRGRDEAAPGAASYIRFPAGHPEGFQEAFANIYRAFATTLKARKAGTDPASIPREYPGLAEGSSGIRFVEACLASSRADSRWVEL